MRLFVWLVRAAVFFTLFAFGQEWHAPMVFIVLAAFGLGCAFGIFAMVPSWWRHRRIARREGARAPAATPAIAAPAVGADSPPPHPPRDGL
jgi:uncharacterized integral membrane protein